MSSAGNKRRVGRVVRARTVQGRPPVQWRVAAQFRSVASPKGERAKQYIGRRHAQGNSCVCKADRFGRRCQV
eukprot:6921870-Lingulodinium_polyedra.AAC.1